LRKSGLGVFCKDGFPAFYFGLVGVSPVLTNMERYFKPLKLTVTTSETPDVIAPKLRRSKLRTAHPHPLL